MTKTHFRILVVCSFILPMISGFLDGAFPNENLTLVTNCLEILEADQSNTKKYFTVGFGLLAVIYSIYCLLGLLLFWNSARVIYLLGFFIFMPFYFFISTEVSSAIGLALFDTGNVLSGVILGLIYYSPVKNYFIEKTAKSIWPTPG